MIRKISQGAVCLWVAVAATALAADRPEFSADMVTRMGGQTVSGKLYVAKDKMRYEMPQAITITRLDRKASYVLMPEQKMYMQQPLSGLEAAKAGIGVEGELERVPMGKETVDGRSTEKFRVTYTAANGSATMFQWLDANGVPAKVEAEDGSWSVEYKNANFAAQSDALFEIPADYQAFVMPAIPGMGAGEDT